jgi:multiple sugar transport system permease protein
MTATRPVLVGVEASGPGSTTSTIGPSPRHRRPRKWAALLRTQFGRVALMITMICLLFPIYWLVQASLSPNGELFHTPPYFFPPHPTFQGYVGAWRLIGVDLLHSLVIAAGVVVLDCALAVSAGYGLFLARVRRSATLVRLLVLVGIVFPTILFVVPLDQLLVTVHLLNTYPGLVLADSLYAAPLGVLIVYTYMLSIPHELVEAASIDGASSARALWSVVVPIAAPAIAVTAIFAFLTAWGDYLFAETFTSGNSIAPASVSIANLSTVGVTSPNPVWDEVMAGSVILALPVLLAVIFAQRYIRMGISGAIKG